MLSSSCEFDRHIGACYLHLVTQVVSSTDTSGHAIFILWIWHTHHLAIIILWVWQTHRGMLSSPCEFDRHTSSCYHLVSLTDTSSCYHHLVSLTDTSSCYHHLVSLTDTSSCYHHLVSLTDTSSSCEFYRHICMLLLWVLQTHLNATMMPVIVWVRQKHRRAMILSVIISIPNEDFGRRNKRWNQDFRSTFQGREYSIWATNRWKVLRKSWFHLLFLLPKSSFGEHKL